MNWKLVYFYLGSGFIRGWYETQHPGGLGKITKNVYYVPSTNPCNPALKFLPSCCLHSPGLPPALISLSQIGQLTNNGSKNTNSESSQKDISTEQQPSSYQIIKERERLYHMRRGTEAQDQEEAWRMWGPPREDTEEERLQRLIQEGAKGTQVETDWPKFTDHDGREFSCCPKCKFYFCQCKEEKRMLPAVIAPVAPVHATHLAKKHAEATKPFSCI